MKILIVGESPAMPTGFGQQCRLLVEGFLSNGHEVVLMAGAVKAPKFKHGGYTEWRFQNIHDLPSLERQIHSVAPDVCLCFGCTAFIMNMINVRQLPMNCPVFYWLPYEGSKLPESYKRGFSGMPSNTIIHLTSYAKDLWSDVVTSDLIIGHGVNGSIWKYNPAFDSEAKNNLRKKWSIKLKAPMWDDDLVILNSDRNIHHKRWDATMDYISKLKKLTRRRVVLLAHTKPHEKGDTGHPEGWNIPELVKNYGLDDNVIFTGFDWYKCLTREELVELYRICNFRLSTSMGEGFGVPTAEAAMIGTPQILNGHTSLPEILGADNPMLVEPAMRESRMDSLWNVPNTSAMAQRTLELLENPDLLAFATESARMRVNHNYSHIKVTNHFLMLFKSAIESNDKTNLFYNFRWGYRQQGVHAHIMGDCGRVASKLNNTPKVLEIGSHDGKFLEICSEFGLNCKGIESDALAIARANLRVQKQIIKVESYKDPWPEANILVVTDMQDGWLDDVEKMFEKIAEYDWALIRFDPRRRWGLPSYENVEKLRAILISKGMNRRRDIEKIMNELPNFAHEVWHRNGGLDVGLPRKVQEFKELTNGDTGK